jgi:hypothetical protein
LIATTLASPWPRQFREAADIISAELISATYRGLWRVCAVYGRLESRSKRVPTDARRVLEQVILPAIYADSSIRTILFVGVGPYTKWYSTAFNLRPRLSFSTIDPDPQVARWGARGRHRVDRVEALASEAGSRDAYDLVLANGVFGFGIDSAEENAAMIDASHAVLHPGGILLVGYSLPGTFDPDLVDGRRFRPSPIPGLAADRYLTRNENRHSFACFAKV